MKYSEATPIVTFFRHKYDMIPVGSYARKSEEVHDLDFITKEDLNRLWHLLYSEMYLEVSLNTIGDKHLSFYLWSEHGRLKVDVWRYLDKDEKRFLKLMRTLDKEHSIYWKNQANKYGYRLTDKGLYKINTDILIEVRTIKELRKLLHIK